MMNNNEKEILEDIKNQISFFDNKASILLTATGIVFALTLVFLELFINKNYIDKSQYFKNAFITLFVIYIFVSAFSLVSLVLVIIPRGHKKDATKYPNYYKDITKMDDNELRKQIKFYYKNDNLIVNQIKINSYICNIKHRWTIISFISLIAFLLIFISLVLLILFS